MGNGRRVRRQVARRDIEIPPQHTRGLVEMPRTVHIGGKDTGRTAKQMGTRLASIDLDSISRDAANAAVEQAPPDEDPYVLAASAAFRACEMLRAELADVLR